MKKILISSGIIGIVAVAVVSGTIAYFSDTEIGAATLTAGVIDIVVDDQNPWAATYEQELSDMKPCQTRYIEFTVRNLIESNPIKLYKHIDIIEQTDGLITEPECEEGGGAWTGNGLGCTDPQNCCTNYTPRNNLAAYIIYDMQVCKITSSEDCETDEETGKPINDGWIVVIDENQFVRLDNISSSWIYLEDLQPGEQLKVVQSYHLSSWPDAPEPEVTNWAQGDVLNFNIELMGTQIDGEGPEGAMVTVILDNKDPITWETIEDNRSGQLTYNTSGSTFDYSLIAAGLNASTEYSLIYYADSWPGNNPGALIGTHITDGSGAISALGQSVNLNMDLPDQLDDNYPAGAKVWLVPSSNYNGIDSLIVWNPETYLFETKLIKYDDTDF